MRASNQQVEVNTPENPDSFAAVCKECGNGTLNNAATNSFKHLVGYDEYEGMDYVVCRCCGSTHVDVVVL